MKNDFLIRGITALENGSVLVMDELDASLHPMIVMNLISVFHNDGVNKNGAHLKIYDLLKQNPKGWSFSRHHRQGHNPNKYNPFCDSQLNFAFISRYVLEREDFPDVNPEKGEGFEDRIYSMILYCKYYDTY